MKSKGMIKGWRIRGYVAINQHQSEEDNKLIVLLALVVGQRREFYK